MKIVCDFCKTEYKLDKIPNGSVRCAVCGHVWSPQRARPQNLILKFLAALCALIAAGVFAVVVIVGFNENPNKYKPIVASIDEQSVHVIKDKDGENRVFVAGNITNNTDDIYGLPNIVIISYDANNIVLSRQMFMPPAPLLDAKSTIVFNYLLSSVEPSKVKRVEIELRESK